MLKWSIFTILHRTTLQSSPLHNQPSQKFRLYHSNTAQNNSTHSSFRVNQWPEWRSRSFKVVLKWYQTVGYCDIHHLTKSERNQSISVWTQASVKGHYHYHCLWPLLENRLPTQVLQLSQSWASLSSCPTVTILFASALWSWCQVFLRQVCFLFPYGFQVWPWQVVQVTDFWRMFSLSPVSLEDLVFYRLLAPRKPYQLAGC